MSQAEPERHRGTMWSDEAFGATDFLFADYCDLIFPAHVHETFTIGVLEAGGHRVRAGRASALVAPPGTVGVMPPGVVHDGRPASEAGCRYRVFYPSPAMVASALEHPQRGPLSGEWGLGRHVIDDRQLYREFLALHWSSQLEETLLERQSRIAEFLRRLFERHGNFSPEQIPARTAPRTVTRVRDYLHSMYQEQISVADLAQAVGVSGTQVIRAFSAGTGMPPHAYLISLRVERAKVLLREGRSASEVALETGFYDQSQLTRHFKRLTGVTPARFAAQTSTPRQRHREDSAPPSAQRPRSPRLAQIQVLQ